jgi:ribonuclease-3
MDHANPKLEQPPLERLEERLGYAFTEREHLTIALTHKSYANERGPECEHNERLEFLGDAVVALVVGHLLMSRNPKWSEGELSKARSALVSEAGLARLARRIQLGDWLRLGKGEDRTQGRDKPSIQANAFEALAAAVYLDGGFAAAFEVLRALFEPLLQEALRGVGQRDPKTTLQELVQGEYKCTPTYQLVDTSGPEHDKRFSVRLDLDGQPLAHGEGRTKKEAEQEAASRILERIAAGEALAEIVSRSDRENLASEEDSTK